MKSGCHRHREKVEACFEFLCLSDMCIPSFVSCDSGENDFSYLLSEYCNVNKQLGIRA